MSESYGLQFNVDASGIGSGLQAYKSAVDGIQSSLKQFEQTATKTFATVAAAANNKSNLSSYAKSLQALGNIPIDNAAARKITQLSQAISGFKAPAQSQAASLQAFFRSLSQIPDISSATRSITNLGRLSGSLADFKGPSAGQAENLKAFFKSLAQIPDISAAARSIANVGALSASLADFKAPSTAQSANLREFGKAVSAAMPGLEKLKAVTGLMDAGAELALLAGEIGKIKAPSSTSIKSLGALASALKQFETVNLSEIGHVGTALSGISTFKAPSQAQIKNLVSFVDAIDKMKVPENTSAIAAGLNQISEAATKANGSLGGMRASLGSIPFKGVSSGAAGAKIEMMGLQNAFSATFQAGSVLRSLLGSLTLGELGREFFEANQSANQFQASMEIISENPMFKQLAWDQAAATANKFGTSLATYAAGFSKFAIAAKENNISFAESKKIFDGFQTVTTALHLGTEQTQSVGLAIREAMDKGFISTQLLTRQLGQALPGAMTTLQAAWKASGKSSDNFFDALKKKEVDAGWALDQLADHYKNVYGKSVAQALQSPIQQFNILKNNVMEMMVQIGDAGAKSAFADLIKQFSSYMDPASVHEFTKAISEGLVSAIDKLSAGLKFLHDNWDSIKGPLGTTLELMGKWALLSAGFKIGEVIKGQLSIAAGAFNSIKTSIVGIPEQMGALTAESSALGGAWSRLTGNLVPLNAGMEQFGVTARMASGSMTLAELEASILGRSVFALAGAAEAVSVSLRSAAAALVSLMMAEEGAEISTVAITVSLGAFNIMTNAVRLGVNAVSGAFSGMMGLVGGPVGAAVLVLGGALMTAYSATTAFNAGLADQKRSLVSTQSALDGANKLMGTYHDKATDAATGVDGVGGASLTASGKVDTFAGKVGNAATELRKMAQAARDAQIATINQEITSNSQAGQKLLDSTVDGSNKNFSTHSIGSTVSSLYNSFSARFTQGFNYAINRRDMGQEAVDAASGYAKQNEDLKKARDKLLGTSDETIAKNSGAADADTGRSVTDPIYHGATGEKGKKDHSLQQLEAFESELDSFFKKLDNGDGASKIFEGWATTLDKGAKALMGKSGYAAAIDTIRTSGHNATTAAMGLVDALSDPKNLTPTASKGLEKVGVSATQLAALIKKEASAIDDSMAAATAKEFTDKYKKYDDLMKKLSETDPVLKVKIAFDDKIFDESKSLLSSTGMEAFKPSLEALHDGALSAASAVAVLIKLLNDPKNLADSAFTKNLPAIVAMLNGEVSANTKDMRTATKKDTFGSGVMDDLKKETEQYQMSSSQMEVYKDLQKAISEDKDRQHTASQAEISDLQKRIELQQRLNETLKVQQDMFKNNGIRQWASSTMQAGDAVNALDKDLADGLEKTLEEVGTKGVFSLKSLAQSIQGTLVKKAAQDLTKQMLNGISGQKMFDDKGNMSNTNYSFFDGIAGMKRSDQVSAETHNGTADMGNTLKFYDDGNGALKVVMTNSSGQVIDKSNKGAGISKGVTTALPTAAAAPTSLGVTGTANTANPTPAASTGNAGLDLNMVTLMATSESALSAALGGFSENGALKVYSTNPTTATTGAKSANGLGSSVPANGLTGVLTGMATGTPASTTATSPAATSAASSGLLSGPLTSLLGPTLGGVASLGANGATGGAFGLVNGLPNMLKGVKSLFTSNGVTGMAGVNQFLGIGGSNSSGGGSLLNSIFGGGKSSASSLPVSGLASAETPALSSSTMSSLDGAIPGLTGGSDASSMTSSLTSSISNATTTGFSGAIDNVSSSFTSQMGTSVGSISDTFGSTMGDSISGLGSDMSSLFGGGSGSSGGGLGSLLGGDSGLAGLFREGGYTGSPVGTASGSLYSFSSAPHFATGTANTGNFSGGMPAVLHQNEAVIPLSRGRSIPVQFSGGGAMGGSQQPAGSNITFNVTSPDPDSFRRSQSQLATQAYAVGTKASRRNG